MGLIGSLRKNKQKPTLPYEFFPKFSDHSKTMFMFKTKQKALEQKLHSKNSHYMNTKSYAPFSSFGSITTDEMTVHFKILTVFTGYHIKS